MSQLNPNPPEDVFELTSPKKEPEGFLVAGLFYFPADKTLSSQWLQSGQSNVYLQLRQSKTQHRTFPLQEL